MPDTFITRAMTALESVEDTEAAAEAYLAYQSAKAQLRRYMAELDAQARIFLVPAMQRFGPLEIGDVNVWAGKETKIKPRLKGREMAERVVELYQGDVTALFEALQSDCFKQGQIKKDLGEEAWEELYRAEIGSRIEVRAIPKKLLENRGTS